MNPIIVEILGYAASVFVAVSLLMTAIKKLRVLNLVGSTLFVIYAIMLPSIPVLITNGFIVIINVVQLVKLAKNKTPAE